MTPRSDRSRRFPAALVRAAVILLAAVPLVAGPPAHSAEPLYRLIPVISGLNQPVYMAAPPGETTRYFIVEKPGYIRILKSGRLLSTPFLDIHSLVSTDSERGLLSMAFDPRYRTNRRFYVYYTNRSGTIVIARFLTKASSPNRADPASRHVLLSIAHPGYSNHNGGQLQFDPIAAKSGQAILYLGTGDGGGAGDPNNNA